MTRKMEVYNTKEKLFNELVTFVRNQIGVYDTPITRDTLIEDELGVTGDDAYDLIISFGKKYKIKVDTFNLGKYFGDEPGLFPINREIKPFTIGHLEKAVMAGRLDEEVINS
jgi:acyl carrier protein